MRTTYLTIATDPPIPDDVLIEHVSYHLRTDFKENSQFIVKVRYPPVIEQANYQEGIE